ncbi:MAG TPA: GNAT family N-acetyltransferase [Oculatellaceae cyanobacterium]
MAIVLSKPSLELLPSYLEALAEGSFCNMALGDFGDESVEKISEDPSGYIARITDPAPRKVKVPNGSVYELRNHELWWLHDGLRFLGTVSLRFAGDREVIEEYGGHVGLAIRPALLNKGYGVRAAQLAWKLVAETAISHGLRAILVTCNPDNAPSRRLIEHNGGKLVKRLEDALGTGPSLLYEIVLTPVTEVT